MNILQIRERHKAPGNTALVGGQYDPLKNGIEISNVFWCSRIKNKFSPVPDIGSRNFIIYYAIAVEKYSQ